MSDDRKDGDIERKKVEYTTQDDGDLRQSNVTSGSTRKCHKCGARYFISEGHKC